jgi:hypothetical protein
MALAHQMTLVSSNFAGEIAAKLDVDRKTVMLLPHRRYTKPTQSHFRTLAGAPKKTGRQPFSLARSLGQRNCFGAPETRPHCAVSLM